MIQPKYTIELTIQLEDNKVGVVNDIYISSTTSDIVYEIKELNDDGMVIAYPLIREDDLPEQLEVSL